MVFLSVNIGHESPDIDLHQRCVKHLGFRFHGLYVDKKKKYVMNSLFCENITTAKNVIKL